MNRNDVSKSPLHIVSVLVRILRYVQVETTWIRGKRRTRTMFFGETSVYIDRCHYIIVNNILASATVERSFDDGRSEMFRQFIVIRRETDGGRPDGKRFCIISFGNNNICTELFPRKTLFVSATMNRLKFECESSRKLYIHIYTRRI